MGSRPYWRYPRTPWTQSCATCSGTTLLALGNATRGSTVVLSRLNHSVIPLTVHSSPAPLLSPPASSALPVPSRRRSPHTAPPPSTPSPARPPRPPSGLAVRGNAPPPAGWDWPVLPARRCHWRAGDGAAGRAAPRTGSVAGALLLLGRRREERAGSAGPADTGAGGERGRAARRGHGGRRGRAQRQP